MNSVPLPLFGDIVNRQILSEDEKSLAPKRKALMECVGIHGQLMVALLFSSLLSLSLSLFLMHVSWCHSDKHNSKPESAYWATTTLRP